MQSKSLSSEAAANVNNLKLNHDPFALESLPEDDQLDINQEVLIVDTPITHSHRFTDEDERSEKHSARIIDKEEDILKMRELMLEQEEHDKLHYLHEHEEAHAKSAEPSPLLKKGRKTIRFLDDVEEVHNHDHSHAATAK